jgi:hypothetical protein
MLQTQLAAKATDLAETFRGTLGRHRFAPHAYVPDMTAPEGVSTGGGVQSMQHLRLLPPQANMPTLVVGHLDQKQGIAELRTFEHVDAICRERFKQGAPLDPVQYAQFLQSAQAFLSAYGMRVSFSTPPPELAANLARVALTPSTAPPRSRAGMVFTVMALVFMAAGLAAAVTWFLVKK